MGLETGTYISDLVATNPVSNDPKSQGDDHLRLLKSTIKTTFPGVAGAVTPTHTELNYVDGVTSAIQGQIDLKAPLDSPSLTGVPTTPTADAGTSGGQVASLDFVIATALGSSLPGQTGNGGKFISTDGVNGFWEDEIDGSVVSLLGGGDLVGTTATQSLSNKSLTTPTLQDSTDTTKKANLILSGVTAGQNRNIIIADEDMKLFTPGWELLSTITASSSATIDIESELTANYDIYKIIIENITHSHSSSSDLRLRYKKSGAYLSSTNYSFLSPSGGVVSGVSSITVLANIGNATNGQTYLQINLVRPAVSHQHFVAINGGCSNGLILANAGGQCTSMGVLEGIRFLMGSGNISTGTFRVFGVRKI